MTAKDDADLEAFETVIGRLRSTFNRKVSFMQGNAWSINSHNEQQVFWFVGWDSMNVRSIQLKAPRGTDERCIGMEQISGDARFHEVQGSFGAVLGLFYAPEGGACRARGSPIMVVLLQFPPRFNMYNYGLVRFAFAAIYSILPQIFIDNTTAVVRTHVW